MKTVLCHGCFDVIHSGHLAYFKAAKKFGDKLIVSVTSDRYVMKGPGRPYFSAGQRAEMVRALGIVDDVIISDSPTAVQVIEQIKPDFYVKGPDYKDLDKDVTGGIHEEKAAVEEYGGKLVFTEEETFSSSSIINKFLAPWTDKQKEIIERVKDLGGFDACKKAIDALSKLEVLVVGEPIIDIYRFCRPEGISSKSPTVSARYSHEEKYKGGSMAIVNHLANLCEAVTSPVYSGEYPEKIRYISSDNNQRVFEVTHINEKHWRHDEISTVISLFKGEVIVAADFGHGLFNDRVRAELWDCNLNTFLGLNVQANSSNYGFNVFTQHRVWDYLCLDVREARLAAHNRYASPLVLGRDIWCKYERPVSLTRGPDGSALWLGDREITSPAFTDTIVDATGAGDAYFAITTVLLSSNCKPELVLFIGNVFAGLKTKIIGNKEAVSKVQLLKAIESILK